jgi:hypothetical protein
MRRWATAAAGLAAFSALFALVGLGIGDVSRRCDRDADRVVSCSWATRHGGWVRHRTFRAVTGASVTPSEPDVLGGSRSHVVVLTYGSGNTAEFEARDTRQSADRRARELNNFIDGTILAVSESRDPSTLGVFALISLVAATMAAMLFAFAGVRRKPNLSPNTPVAVPTPPAEVLAKPATRKVEVRELAGGWSRPDRFPWGSDQRVFDGPNGRYEERVALPEPTGLRVVAPATDQWNPTRLHLMNDPTKPGDLFRLAVVAAPRRAVTSVRLQAEVALNGVPLTGDPRIVRGPVLACNGESPFTVWVRLPDGHPAADYSWTVSLAVTAPDTPKHNVTFTLPAPLMAEWAEGCRTLRYLGYSDVRNCGASHAQVMDAYRAGLARLALDRPLSGYTNAVRSGLAQDKIVELGRIDEWGLSNIVDLVKADATFNEMLELFTKGFSRWGGVENYLAARRYASHAEVIEVFDAGGSIRGYEVLRRNDVTHAEAIDAANRGIDLTEYWVGRVRETDTFGVERRIPITHAQVIEAHEAGVWLSAYGVARLNGFEHDELLVAHATGQSLHDYTRSKRTVARTAAEVLAHATLNPIGSGRW